MTGLRRAVVVGASRGIGKALVEELDRRGTAVTGTVRDPHGSGPTGDGRSVVLDLSDPDAGRALEAVLRPGELDALIVNAGIFGPAHQDVAQVECEETAELFWTNAIAPVRLARRLLPLVRRGGVIAFMSSRTASIALNAEGDMELYRASKAALNALSRSFAVKDALPADIAVLLLHPGWVQTEMGGSNAPVTIRQSVAGLSAVIERALDHPTFRFTDYQGDELAW